MDVEKSNLSYAEALEVIDNLITEFIDATSTMDEALIHLLRAGLPKDELVRLYGFRYDAVERVAKAEGL